MTVLGFPEIRWLVGSPNIAVHSMTPEIAEAIREVGGEPAEYNRMVWPIGASRFAVGRFILHETFVDEVQQETGLPLLARSPDDTTPWRDDPPPSNGTSFIIGSLQFDRMYMRNPVPLLTSEGSGVVYAVEVVDERFFFQTIGSDRPGYNVSLSDKEKLFDVTENETGPEEFTAWTLKDAIEDMVDSLPTTSGWWNLPGALNANTQWRDLVSDCLTVPKLIDRLLTQAGYVLVAYPALNYPGGEGYRYEAVPIGDGEARARANLEAFTNDLLGGGIYAASATFDPPPIGAGRTASSGNSVWLTPEVPSDVAVNFPVAGESGSGYTLDDEDGSGDGIPYETQRFERVITEVGRPEGTNGNGNRKCLFDTVWAIVDSAGETTNLQQLFDRADVIATAYYDRFRAGCGDILFRGTQLIFPYPGSQEIIWSLTDRGPMTRVRGDYSDPLFGFRIDTPLTAADVMSTGGVRGMPRSDGSILFDMIQKGTTRLHYGKITAVQGGPNATYDAEAYDDPSISVSAQSPRRPHDTDQIDVAAQSVNSPCVLGQRPVEGQADAIDLYVLDEVPATVGCLDGLAQQQPIGNNPAIYAMHFG